MKRHLIIVAVFLLAGAVVNVAVAWGCAASVDVFEHVERSVQDYEEYSGNWQVDLWSTAGAALIISSFWRFPNADARGGLSGEPPHELLPSWTSLDSPVPPGGAPAPGQWVGRFNDARGWPLLALYSEGLVIVRTRRTDDRTVSWGVVVPLPTWSHADWTHAPPIQHPRILPFRPIWPGFAVNTIIYGALLWLLIAGPFALRRLLRIRRGLCPKCAYPIGDSPNCTECGTTLPTQTRAAT